MATIGEIRKGKGAQLREAIWQYAEQAIRSSDFGFKKMWIRISERVDSFDPNLSHRYVKIFDKKPTPLVNTLVYYVDWDAGECTLIRCLPKKTNIILPEHLENSQPVDEVVMGSVRRMQGVYNNMNRNCLNQGVASLPA